MKTKLFRLTVIALMGALLLGAAGTTLPVIADAASSSTNSDAKVPCHGGPGGGLDQALENGTITQAEYDAIKALQVKMEELKDDYTGLSQEERRAAMEEDRKEILGQMLSAGTITQEVYDKLMKGPVGRPAGDRMGGLDQALENGKITQAEYDALKALREKMEELKDNYTDLSQEERRTAMEEDRKEILGQMLSAGTITQEVYDKLITDPMGSPAGLKGDRMGGLDQALENGKITQAEYNAMKAVQEKMAELKDDYSNLSREERRSAMEKARTEILDKMLTDGTISQELYDKLIDVPQPGTGFGGGRGERQAR